MSPTQLIPSALGAWRWLKLPEQMPASTSASVLQKQGYELLPADRPMLIGCIAGQLGRLRQVEQPGGHAQVWGHRSDRGWAEAYPVALGALPPEMLFEIFPYGPVSAIELNTRRPPGLGEVALLAEGESWHTLESSLSADSASIYAELDQRVRAIWGDPGREPEATLLWICRMASGYELQRQHWEHAMLDQPSTAFSWLRGVFLPSKDGQRRHWEKQLALLEEAHRVAQSPASVSDETWDELRNLAQQLAKAYALAGRPGLRLIRSSPDDAQPVPRSLHTAPLEESSAPVETITIPDDPVSRALLLALRDPRRFQVDSARGLARCDLPVWLAEGEGTLALTLPAACREVLGEHLLATWLAIESLLIGAQPEDLTVSAPLTNKDILAQLRLVMSKGGVYARDQNLRLLAEVETLAQLHISVSLPLPPRRPKAPISSPLLHVTLREVNPDKREVASLALGNWIWRVPQFPRQTCTIPASLLKLSKYAFRLGLELALTWPSHPKGIDIVLKTLFDQAGITIKKNNPEVSLGYIEKAFEQLVEARIIAHAHYRSLVPGSKVVYPYRWLVENRKQLEEVTQQQEALENRWSRWNGHYWKGYVEQRVHIDPPAALAET